METDELLTRAASAHRSCVKELLGERTETGHWVGRLSNSSLSTATVVSALSLYLCDPPEGRFDEETVSLLIENGARYLLASQNDDGGWGDTDKSYSNIATSYLGWAALHLVAQRHPHLIDPDAAGLAIERVKKTIDAWGGIPALRRRYGKDKTFVVPILSNCALAGIVAWSEVAALPFEVAWVPQRFYRFMQMPVVSYAVPALVAIGQAKFLNDPPALPWRWVRQAAMEPTLNVLEKMQPASGGYLEAAPLTSFVAMSLAATGRSSNPVTVNAIQFLIDNVLDDGSWPIDTNLATWVTSLSINALSTCDSDSGHFVPADLIPEEILSESGWQWLLACQYDHRHPFTGADPGGWGWTDLTGSVPDADDTPGALLSLFVALRLQRAGRLRLVGVNLNERAAKGIVWLLDLQNSDGGWPTFCRGWGKLPFDRSGVDLTAHVIRAFTAWIDEMDAALQTRMQKALFRGLSYIQGQQRTDGSWLPLWFGNQDQPDDENPIYGISKTAIGLCDLRCWLLRETQCRGRSKTLVRLDQMLWQAINRLANLQNQDQGWGGGSSLQAFVGQNGNRSGSSDRFSGYSSSTEETALAVEAMSRWLDVQLGLKTADPKPEGSEIARITEISANGVRFLCQRIERQEHRNSWPIGFYFAKLWYHEHLYPLIFATAALGTWRRTWRFSQQVAEASMPSET